MSMPPYPRPSAEPLDANLDVDPLTLGIKSGRVRQVDLEFQGVYRDQGSFVVLPFLNAPRLPANVGRDHEGFAAAFSVVA
jgi:hypothetical protein